MNFSFTKFVRDSCVLCCDFKFFVLKRENSFLFLLFSNFVQRFDVNWTYSIPYCTQYTVHWSRNYNVALYTYNSNYQKNIYSQNVNNEKTATTQIIMRDNYLSRFSNAIQRHLFTFHFFFQFDSVNACVCVCVHLLIRNQLYWATFYCFDSELRLCK